MLHIMKMILQFQKKEKTKLLDLLIKNETASQIFCPKDLLTFGEIEIQMCKQFIRIGLTNFNANKKIWVGELIISLHQKISQRTLVIISQDQNSLQVITFQLES